MQNYSKVVFISEYPRSREWKLALGIKALGKKVFLLTQCSPGFKDLTPFEDVIQFQSWNHFCELMDQIRPDVCHISTTYNYNVAALVIQHFPGVPIAIDPYDILFGMFKDHVVKERKWEQQIELERYCFANADALCCRSMTTQNYRKIPGFRFKSPRTLVYDSCLPSNNLKPKISDGRIHAVAVGSIVIEKVSPEYNGHGGCLWIAKRMLQAGICFHIYPSTNCYTGTFEDAFSDYLELQEKTNGQIRIYEPIPYDQLIPEISQYHFGLNINSPDWEYNTDELAFHERKQIAFHYSIGNRIFDYLEAGLPIMAEPKLFAWFLPILKKRGVLLDPYPLLYSPCVEFNPSALDDAEKHVASACEFFGVANQTRHLDEFYQRIITDKKKALFCSEFPTDKHSCLVLSALFGSYVDKVYSDSQNEFRSYHEQRHLLLNTLAGPSDSIAHGLQELDWNTDTLIVNCPAIQKAWAKEFGNPEASLLSILMQQIQQKRPEVVIIQDPRVFSREALLQIKGMVRILAAIVNPSMTNIESLCEYHVLFARSQATVRTLRQKGFTAYYAPHSIDSRANFIPTKFEERKIPCAFYGNLNAGYQQRKDLMIQLANSTPIHFWGPTPESSAGMAQIAQKYHGEVWGQELFYLLGQTKLVVHCESDESWNETQSARIYETSACGALVICKSTPNLSEILQPETEIITFQTPEEAAEKITYYLAHPKEAEAIAQNARQRVLDDHSQKGRMNWLSLVLEQHLRYQTVS